MNKYTGKSISPSNTKGEDRAKTVEKLESNYKGQYGEYKWYAGQTFVFKDEKVANKTLLISDETPNHDNRPYLKFRARPVYTGDSQEDLKEVIKDWKEEDNWYLSEFHDIPGLVMPKETYRICEDPLGSKNKTVLISTKWIDNIQGDIFRIDPDKLHSYITKYPQFKNTLVSLIKKFLELAEKDIYPDYLGADNVAIYLEKNIPNVALIDRHIIWIGKYCKDGVKRRLDSAILRFKQFIQDPEDIKRVGDLTGNKLNKERS
jgi:hypothetical protein